MSIMHKPTEQTQTLSLDAFLAEEVISGGPHGTPDLLRIGKDAIYVSFFTNDGVPVTTHYLDEAEDWAAGYVHCTGKDCPACKAGLTASRFLLLPVFDRIEGKIAVLRVSTQKGAGKLATEMGKVLSLPDRDKVIAKITRDSRYTYTVEPKPAPEHDPQIQHLVQAFIEGVKAGLIDLTDCIRKVPAEELAKHPRIARVLALEGEA